MLEQEVNLYTRRAEQFSQHLDTQLYAETVLFEAEYSVSPDHVPYEQALNLTYRKIKEGETWGRNWEYAWFRLRAVIPEEWDGREIDINLNLGGESLLYDKAGTPLFSLTNSSVYQPRYARDFFALDRIFKAGEVIELMVECAAHGFAGLGVPDNQEVYLGKPDIVYNAVAKRMRLLLFNKELWELKLDAEVLFHQYSALPENDYRRKQLLAALTAAQDTYAEDPRNAAAARAKLAPLLARKAASSALTAHAVGHAHIDTGWLWQVKESVQKCARTFASQLSLIKKYPDYIFAASSPQHYEFIKENFPGLYPQLRQAIKDGRWEPVGGMWVEADCNLTSGESLVRQFLLGKNFFKDEFDVEVNNLWLPDVFGYSAALPQIMLKSGCKYFLTQKISWNQFNHFPHHSFYWQGIDGSKVLTHFPPEDTYNSQLQANALYNAQNHYAEAAESSRFMSLFGLGDGGGGPSEEMIGRGLRQRDLDGQPKVKFSKSFEFFELLEKESGDILPVWNGELYLEFHRGTLTTQAAVKRYNRKNEQLLTAAEFFFSALPVEQYPYDEMNKFWKLLLINQFHDIIPGSSIREVYERTWKEHEQIQQDCKALLRKQAEQFFRKDDNALTVVNTLSVPYNMLLQIPEDWQGAADENGNVMPCQILADGRRCIRAELPGSSFRTFRKSEGAAVSETGNALVLENDLVRYEFNENGEVISACDKEEKRSILQDGTKGNVFTLYTDRSVSFEAWDIDVYYLKCKLETAHSTSPAKIEYGPLRSSIHFALAIGSSTLDVETVLESDSKLLTFNVKTDWREARRMLRVTFPANMLTDQASFDIQYGYLKRSMNSNTSWEAAQFEACGQRYVDISSEDYGVALVNDCKYGHRVKNSILDLCLLRSPKWPDWEADQGKHEFSYGLLPHKNALSRSDVMETAACFNRAPLTFAGLDAAGFRAPCHVEGNGITLEVVKKAEKSDDLILRIFENRGEHNKGKLILHENCQVVETNLIEWEDAPEASCIENSTVDLTMRPFEIRSYRLKRS